MLPKGDILLPAKKVSRKRDTDGNLFGIANENTILDTRICEIQFPDRHTDLYAANIIVEDVYSQVDHEGNQFLLLEIIDHHCNEKVITIQNEYVNLPGGQCLKKSTEGWQLKVQWKEGMTTWETLWDLKESNPIEIAEHVIVNDLCKEPAFAWWVPFTLKKRHKIVASIQSREKNERRSLNLELNYQEQ